jgi:hypothetical protein
MRFFICHMCFTGWLLSSLAQPVIPLRAGDGIGHCVLPGDNGPGHRRNQIGGGFQIENPGW